MKTIYLSEAQKLLWIDQSTAEIQPDRYDSYHTGEESKARRAFEEKHED